MADDITEAWNNYKNHFIAWDGRVIDYYQDGISHSEGQGYAMLLAVFFDDHPVFERLWKWTSHNLQVRKSDSLFAWKWGLRPNGQWTVIDYNNATDGDTLIAYALVIGGRKWNNNIYINEGLSVVRSIRERLIVKSGEQFYVLPGYYGFFHKNQLILNPSYFVFPAYRLFASIDSKEFWEKVYDDSLEFIRQSQFSYLKLPADWVMVKGNDLSVYAEKSRFFGYEAIRVPLYLSLLDDSSLLSGFVPLLDLKRKLGYVPGNVDLINSAVSLHDAPAGFYAVYALIAKKIGDRDLSSSLFENAREKLKNERDDYYSHTLFLLSSVKMKK